jgi:hypothetical protein
MTTVLLILVCLLGALVVVLLGALVELFKQVQQIRAELQLDGSAGTTPIGLGERQGVAPSAIGLPAELDEAGGAIVLFLSDRCTTCRSIAASLQGAVPPGVWIVAEPVAGVDADAGAFLEEFRLGGGRTLIDSESGIADRLSLDITPAAVFVENGRLERAETVPSPRRLSSLLSSWKPPPGAARPPVAIPAVPDDLTRR